MPNDKVILIVRTIKKDDHATRYIFSWAESIKIDAELLGWKVIDLQNENFTEEKMKKMVEEFDPSIIFLNGHGTEYSIKGEDGETDVITRCKNDHLFKGRIIYALSCNTAKILGKSSYNKGCKSYIGYTQEIVFPNKEMENPLEDNVSESFMMVSNEIISTLIRGGSSEQAILNFYKLSDALISYWKKNSEPQAPIIQRYLENLKKLIHAPSL